MPEHVITIILCLFMAVFFFFIRKWQKKIGKIVEGNFQIVAKLLNSKIEKTFTSIYVKGNYKDRDVIFLRDNMKHGIPITIEMIPQITARPKKQRMFTVKDHSLSPTEHTNLTGEKVYYGEKGPSKSVSPTGLDEPRDEQYILSILSELRKAVEVVETGAPYYKEN